MPVIAAHKINIEDSNMAIYNAMDTMLTYEVNTAQDQLYADKLAHAGDRMIYAFERAMQAPAMEMMQRGFRVDPEVRELTMRAARRKLYAITNLGAPEGTPPGFLDLIADAIWDRPVNPGSSHQLKSLIYDTMGVKPIVTSVKGERKEQMNREVLERLEDYFYVRPIANAALAYRDLAKTLQVLETEIDNDWRWRCSYNIGGTSTGRWSSSKSPFGTGNNFQNISDELRRIFIADEGYELVGIDLEQAEAREVGWFCGIFLGDWTYLDACESGDLHTFITRMVYPEWDWTGDLKKDRKIAERRFYRFYTYRDANKKLGHGSNYLGRPPTMSLHTKIPLALVRQFQERYFDAFPCIPRMHHYVARELQQKGFLVNAFGRRRDFFNRADADETLRGAVAFLFQSATGDRLNLGLYRVWKTMGLRVQILAQLHDALYFQYRIGDNRNEVVTAAQQCMDVPLTAPNGRVFTIPSEAKAGHNWANRYRLDEEGNPIDWNPEGLDKVRM